MNTPTAQRQQNTHGLLSYSCSEVQVFGGRYTGGGTPPPILGGTKETRSHGEKRGGSVRVLSIKLRSTGRLY